MSDEEEDVSAEEDEDEEEDQEEDDEEEEDEDGDGDGDDEEDEDQDEEGDEQQQQDEEEDGSKQQSEQPTDKLPKFRSLQTQQFKFTNLLSEISSLSLSVDRFIDTLPSHGGISSYHRSSYNPIPLRTSPPQIPLILPREQSRVVIMKDEDTQVSMQPQIIIQPTKVERLVQQPQYKISNESNKFLAQLYEQNKKLKRWQNSSHNVNTHQSGLSSGFYGSRQRFQRQQYQKGLFNVEERNKEIDQAIEMLKRQRD